MTVLDKAKQKRAEIDAVKTENGNLKGAKGKRDKIADAVKKLTKAEFDALPKSLQKELKEFRN